ncbi:MAG: helix-turn-helix domain-containing protein [Candidatus Adiutrix sp.]|jgi:AraC family transcriptional regulator of adaptative response / DNA-3-methyladenine glycosylase II|nr:helix-turn-helix domain-containing protein [Candidatus Adiutrix sp.]
MDSAERRARYAAFKAKDARFDGRFFVGVSSTGIYCRPVCPARLPKEENCTFYETAAAAEQAGYRPCLMCRPELAPGAAPIDAAPALARQAARLLEENCGSEGSLEEYAQRLGCSDRHLRRAFAAAFQVSPVQYLQTCRLLLAKNLLTDTNLTVLEVALAAGFGSLRRFNDLFKSRYRLSPTALRRKASSAKAVDGEITLHLGYRPPYQWATLLDFLAGRAIPGVEAVRGNVYLRTVWVASGERRLYGLLRVEHCPQKNALAVTVSTALLPALPQILARVRHVFDLYGCPDAVAETLSAMNTIAPGLFVPGTRLPGCFEPFEMATRAVLGQQITVKAATTLAGRFAAAFGKPLETGVEGLTRAFPAASDVAALDGDIENRFGPLGITRSRARTIAALAQGMASGELDFTPGLSPEAEIKKLRAIPGVGGWTAHYLAMRALGWADAFPHTDYGVKKALAPLSEAEILKTAEAWRPWRAYATINLWNSLSNT